MAPTVRVAWLVAAFCLVARSSFALEIAVPAIEGPRKAKPKSVHKGLRMGLKAQGVKPVYGERLDRAAAEAGASVRDPEGVRAAGVPFLLRGRIQPAKRGYTLEVVLLAAADGREIASFVRRYKGAKQALEAGKALGAEAAQAAKSARVPERPAEAPESAPLAVEEEEPPASPAEASPESSEPAEPVTPEAAGVAEAPVRREAAADHGEDRLLQLMLGGGAQLASAYTVTVAGDVTGLAYSLSPLLLLSLGVRLTVPDVGVGAELELSFVPVKYAVDVVPPVEPREPTGRFLDIGGAAFYRLRISDLGDGGAIVLSPLLGVERRSLSVEAQGENTVVVSYSSFNLLGGARLQALIAGVLALEADARVGLVLSYAESPKTTGDGGGGLGFSIGGGARYWASRDFALFLGAGYAFQQVGLSGAGTRTPFADDPPLSEATVFNGDLKLTLGVVLAL